MERDESGLSSVVGDTVVDKDGHRLGKVIAVASRPDTLQAEWFVVKTSLFGRQRLVPLACTTDEFDTLHISFSKGAVLSAPVPAVTTSLTVSERRALLEHYGLAA
jgi:hypothetical protein